METVTAFILLLVVIAGLVALLKASKGLREPAQRPPDLAEIIEEAERRTWFK